ncbi:winged helix-turn-helix domain-containing protein [Pseudoalteromonas umbrosa]|uniref:winged helix-turn-helix domain-containing protein n=1 Tax=Pseudoalteromonas umbrosa TaxID=3048489 RepID=UPI0024C38F28|nr:winged helix-turn-helix domain-containing protein [Pseudoalteromonas sp. B95]MDK1290623.1 winged helix-turn-helix domain-containing protein [Pseudoalteromonas sp. B95]
MNLQSTNGQSTFLRKQTYELLKYLLDNNNELCSFDDLLKNLWPNKFVKKESINNEIYEIRKALGDEKSLIKTHRGKGFSINCELKKVNPKKDNLIPLPVKNNRLKISIFIITVMALLYFSFINLENKSIHSPLYEKITNESGSETYFTYNYSKNLFSYVSNHDSKYKVIIRDLNGSRIMKLPDNTTSPYWVELSSTLYFQQYKEENCGIYKVIIDESFNLSAPEYITSCGSVFSTSPIAVDKENKWLYYSYKENHHTPMKIKKLFIPTGESRDILPPFENTYGDYSLSLSPDESQLAIISSDQNTGSTLRVFDLKSRNIKTILSSSTFLYNTAWNASGNSLYFIENGNTISEIEIEQMKTTQLVKFNEKINTLYYDKRLGFVTSKGNLKQLNLALLNIEKPSFESTIELSNSLEYYYILYDSHIPQIWKHTEEISRKVTNFNERYNIEYLTALHDKTLAFTLDNQINLLIGNEIKPITTEKNGSKFKNIKERCNIKNEVISTQLVDTIWNLTSVNLQSFETEILMQGVSSFQLDCKSNSIYFTRLNSDGIYKSSLNNLTESEVILSNKFFEENDQWSIYNNNLYYIEKDKIYFLDLDTNETRDITPSEGNIKKIYDTHSEGVVIGFTREGNKDLIKIK